MFWKRGRFESDYSQEVKSTESSEKERPSAAVSSLSSAWGRAKSAKRSWKRGAIASILAALLFSICSNPLNAQVSVTQNYPAPIGAAVDASGAVYYVSSSRTAILKSTPSAGGYTETNVLTTNSSITGNIAIDGSGTIFAVSFGNILKETPAGGGTYTQTSIPSNITTGLTVDNTGILYGTTATGIVKLTPSGSTYTSSTVITGLSSPTGVAVDSSGNLYIAEGPSVSQMRVLKETLSGGTYTQSVVVSGLTSTKGIAVDKFGNLYISDLHHVYEAVPSGSSYTIRLFSYNDFSAQGDLQPYWLALDPRGTALYVEGAGSIAGPLLAYATSSTDPVGITFASLPVGQSSTQTLTYTFAAATTLGSYRVTTQAATGLDFTDAGGGTCTAGTSYAANTTCTVAVKFAPRYAGARAGAVTFLDGSGNVIEDAFLSGTGTGPQLAYLPATISSIVPGTATNQNAYTGIAVDGNGAVYLSDDINKRVLKETPAGSGTYTESVVASGLLGPKGIVVDGAGNLYVTDNDTQSGSYGLGIALKFTPLTAGGYAKTTIASGLNFSTGIAIDSKGNLFIADSSSSQAIFRLVPLPGGGYSQAKVAAGGGCCGIAVDGSDNIYTSVQQNGVTKFTPDSLGDYTSSTFSNGNVSTSGSIAVDGSGDVYIAGRAQGDNPAVARVKDNGNGSYTLSDSAGSGIITVDGSGSIYGIGSAYSDASGTVYGVYKADQSTPPTVKIDSSKVGMQSAYFNYAELVNIGNAPLNFTVPASGTNPAFSNSDFYRYEFGSSDVCPQLTSTASGANLAPGTECRTFVISTPSVAGPITGMLTYTDDNLNVTGATQAITLNTTGIGSGGPTKATLVWANPAPIAFGTPLSATQLNATANVAGTFVYTPPAGTVLNPGTQTLSVTFTPTDTTNYTGATATVQIIVRGSTQTPTLTWATPAPIVYGTALSATQLNATASVRGTFSYAPTAGTVPKAGTQTLSVTFTPTDTTTYSAATATVQLVVTQAVPTISWAAPAAIAYGTPLSATQLNATASVAGTLTYNPAAGVIPPVGNQILSVTLTPTDSVDYTTASATVSLTVTPSALEYTYANTGANYTTVIPGASTSYMFALAPTSGSYPGDVSFRVTGLPAGASFTLTPATVAQGAGPQTQTLRIQTASQLAGSRPSTAAFGKTAFAPLLAALLIPLSLVTSRRRKLLGKHRLMVLLLGITSMIACGALSGCGSGNGFFGIAPKDYTITVTASSGSIQHAASVTLNLQ